MRHGHKLELAGSRFGGISAGSGAGQEAGQPTLSHHLRNFVAELT